MNVIYKKSGALAIVTSVFLTIYAVIFSDLSPNLNAFLFFTLIFLIAFGIAVLTSLIKKKIIIYKNEEK